jgi:hypothetical protein
VYRPQFVVPDIKSRRQIARNALSRRGKKACLIGKRRWNKDCY